MKPGPRQSVLRSTTLLFCGRLINRFFGLGREVLIATFFGAGWAMDCYNLSYTVATSLRQLFAERFYIPLIPTYYQQREKYGEADALRSISSIAFLLNLLTILVCIALFIFAKKLLFLIAPGFTLDQIQLSTVLVRWFAIAGVAFILHRFYIGLHTCFFRYTVVSFAPILMNVGAISAMVFFSVKFGVVSLAAGVSLGFLAYFFVLIAYLPHRSTILKPSWRRGDPGIKQFGVMLAPLFMIGLFEQTQVYVDRALASGLPEGALSAQGYALRLMHMFSEFCMGTFGTVFFPVFSSLAASEKREQFARNFSLALQSVVLGLLIMGSIIISMALPFVRLLLERGAFTIEDSILTSQLLVYYAVAYIAQAFFIVIIRGFHAHGDTRTPMITTIIAVVVMITADFLLVGPMGIHGLALAHAIGYCLNMVLVYISFLRYLPGKYGIANLKVSLLGLALSAILGWGITHIWQILEGQEIVTNFGGRLLGFLSLSLLAMGVYILILTLLRLPTIEYLINKFKQREKSGIPRDDEEL